MEISPGPQKLKINDSFSEFIPDSKTEELSNSIPDDYSALRGLLVGPEQSRLESLEERLDNPDVRARELAAALPQAVRISTKQGRELNSAMVSVVEESLRASIRKNSQIIVEALFPILGSIIRKAVSTALNGMVESLNRVLEHSLSWESLKWRFEAMRTGKSFAEIAVLHSLLYRVEQVFLIHKKTGALLQSTASIAEQKDKELISGMLTALQDFVRESFSPNKEDELDVVTVGELRVILERGPQAILAAVVRGNPPVTLPVRLQDALDEISRLQENELSSFDGDTKPFEPCLPLLEDCLQAEFRPLRQIRFHALYAFAGLIAILLGWWAFMTLRSNSRWSTFLGALNSEPGIIVTQHGKWGGKYRVFGFIDPLAPDPGELLKRAHLDPREVECQWRSFISLDSPLGEIRARKIFEPPGTVSFRMERGELHVSGVAPHSWIVQARRMTRTVFLNMSWREDGLIDREFSRFQSMEAKLEQVRLEFPLSDAHLGASQKILLDGLLTDFRSLLDIGHALGEVKIQVQGHADPSGSAAQNRLLSQERANQIVRYLVAANLPADRFFAARAGETDSLGCRCALFRIELRPSSDGGASHP